MSELSADEPSRHRGVSASILNAATSVFSDSGIAIMDTHEVTALEAARSYPAAIIGFAGPRIRGALTLVIPWDVLGKSHPAKSADREDLLDWLRELANLTLGSVKIRFAGLGLAMNMGIPTSAVGQTIHFDTSRTSLTAHVLTLQQSDAVLLFDAAIQGDIDWPSEVAAEADSDESAAEALFF